MPNDSENDDWLEGGDAAEESSEGPEPTKGLLVTKQQLHKLTGISNVTLDKYFKEGAPVAFKGQSRREGWKIDTARFIGWLRKRDVAIATGDPETAKYDAAKSADKNAQARLREFQLAKEMNLTITRPQAASIYSRHVGEFRKRLLELEHHVPDITPGQRVALLEQVDNALGEFSGVPVNGEDYDFG